MNSTYKKHDRNFNVQYIKYLVMKKIFVPALIWCLVLTVNVCAQQRTASISFKEESFDFGKIKEADGPVSHVFVVTNTGSIPLIIQNAQPSCGCTTPDWTKQPIMPGAKGFIKATFDPSGRPGTFEKTVTVSSNADRASVILRFTGAVIPKPLAPQDEFRIAFGDLRMKYSYISFGKLTPKDKRDSAIATLNSGKEPLAIKFFGYPGFIKVTAIPEVLKPGQKGIVKISYNASKKGDWGFLYDYLNFSINSKLDPAYKITVSATIEEDFSKFTPNELEMAPKIKFENVNFNFGLIKSGQKVETEFKFRNEGKTGLMLRKVSPSCGCTTTAPKDTVIMPGKASSIKVVFNSGGQKTGPITKTITIISNDPKSPNILLWIKGTLEE